MECCEEYPRAWDRTKGLGIIRLITSNREILYSSDISGQKMRDMVLVDMVSL
jgi:hypothetical protein